MIPMMKWAGRWEWIEEGLDSAGLPQSMALNAIGEFDGYMTMPPELIALRGKLHELGEAAGPLQALWYAHQILQEHSDELVSYMRGDIADEIKVSEVRNRLVGQSLDMARSVRIAAEALRRLYA
jgi:hypothetical protein